MIVIIFETSSRLTPVVTHANAAVETISYATGECALGQVLVARSVKGVCAILIGNVSNELEADLAARFPKANLVVNNAVVHDDLAKVIRFVDKPAEGLYLPLDMRGTAFQRRVWEKLRAISRRSDGDLHGAGPLDQPPCVAPRGGWGMRRQFNRTGCPLPSRGGQ